MRIIFFPLHVSWNNLGAESSAGWLLLLRNPKYLITLLILRRCVSSPCSSVENQSVRHGSPSEWILESKGVLEGRSDTLKDRSDD